MHMTVPQIVLAVFACARLIDGATKYVRKEPNQTWFKLVASVLIWGAIALFALFPEWAHTLSKWGGLGENLNTLIFIGFIVVFAVLFKLLSIIERLERNISEIVRKEALERIAGDVAARGRNHRSITASSSRTSPPRECTPQTTRSCAPTEPEC
jgi:hypothetical protein